jgi:hypothetical protein
MEPKIMVYRFMVAKKMPMKQSKVLLSKKRAANAKIKQGARLVPVKSSDGLYDLVLVARGMSAVKAKIVHSKKRRFVRRK